MAQVHPVFSAAALAVVVAFAGCSGGSQPTPTNTTATTSGPLPATVPATVCGGFRGGVSARASAGPAVPGLLVDATAGENGCLDQVQFTFRSQGDGKLTDAGLAPGYTVQYGDSNQFMDGSQMISLPGAAFLVVTMKPAASVDTTDPNHPQPCGCRKLDSGC